jgi:hypothetical protein
MSHKIEMQFTISVDIDDVEKIQGENWEQAAIESAKVFGEDLNQFLNDHPFPTGFRMQTNTNIKRVTQDDTTTHFI